jgi:bifunctional DNase/RNase
MEVRTDLTRIVISDTIEEQIIVLMEREGSRQFPIVIGRTEAVAIDRRVKSIVTPRPLTHDLLAQMIEELGGELERIVIYALRDDVFYAKLIVLQAGHDLEIDSRPSDAIALGVASDTPIFVEDSVLDQVCGKLDA